MLASILIMLVTAVCGFFTSVLLLRFLMQWLRVNFRNPLGHFVVTTTDWAVRPLRRVVPGWMGMDFASLLPAWGFQTLQAGAALLIRGAWSAKLLPLALSLGAVDLLEFYLYLVMAVVFVAVVMSWVAPYAPLAPLVQALAAPFLRPFRRILPLIGGVDLSPMLLLLLLQIGVMIIGYLRLAVVGAVLG